MSNQARIRLLDYFYWDSRAEIKRPLLAAATVGIGIMSLAFLLGVGVSIPLAMSGVDWRFESVVLIMLMTAIPSTALSAIFFLWHNHRVAGPRRRSSLSLGVRTWESACSIAAALFCGACVATIAIVVTYGVGVLLLLFWPGTTDWQRQLIVYPPVIVGIPAFALGTVGYLIHEWRFERNWTKRVKAYPSH